MKTLYTKLPDYIHAVIAYEADGTPAIILNERVPSTLREYALALQLDFLNLETQLLRNHRHDITAGS